MKTKEIKLSSTTSDFLQCYVALHEMAEEIVDIMEKSGSSIDMDKESNRFFNEISDALDIIMDWVNASIYDNISTRDTRMKSTIEA